MNNDTRIGLARSLGDDKWFDVLKFLIFFVELFFVHYTVQFYFCLYPFISTGTDMPQRFADQFLPFSINQNLSWKKANTTILRMPLAIKSSSDDTKTIFRSQSSEVAVENTLKNFIQHASTALLFLNSVEAVRYVVFSICVHCFHAYSFAFHIV